MSAIETYLQYIASKVWARDVRTAIVNAIRQCYDDVHNPTLNTEALQAAIQAKIDAGQMAALTIGDRTITAAKLALGVIPTPDATLSQSGVPADAKKTGDEITEIKADLDTLKLAMLPFAEHLIGTFDDGNGREYTDTLIAVLESARPEPVVNMTKSENIIGSSAQLYTDEGITAQTPLKTSGSSYYYLDTAATEDCIYKVTVIITPELNTCTYKAVYAYNAEILSGKGTAAPTAYNVVLAKEGSIINAMETPLTENYVFETEISVKAGRNLAIMFYRDYATCIESVTAQKVV